MGANILKKAKGKRVSDEPLSFIWNTDDADQTDFTD